MANIIRYVPNFPRQSSVEADFGSFGRRFPLTEEVIVEEYSGPLTSEDFNALRIAYTSQFSPNELIERVKEAINGGKTVDGDFGKILRDGKIMIFGGSKTEEADSSLAFLAELERLANTDNPPTCSNDAQANSLQFARNNHLLTPISYQCTSQQKAVYPVQTLVFINDKLSGKVTFDYRNFSGLEDCQAKIALDVNGQSANYNQNMWCRGEDNFLRWVLDKKIREQILKEAKTLKFTKL